MWPIGPDHDAATEALWTARDPTTFDGLVHYATLAANSHNAQGWLFRETPKGVAIRPDMDRALPVADGDYHHLYASLGSGQTDRRYQLQFEPGLAKMVDQRSMMIAGRFKAYPHR